MPARHSRDTTESPPRSSPRRIAFLGTRGVPARYGGFEAALEEVGKRLVASGHAVTVYCRSGNDPGAACSEFEGMRLVHLPAIRHRTLETPSHTLFSAAHMLITRERFDAVVVFNAANAFTLPLLRRTHTPVAVHVDGLEWRRTKWGPVGRLFYRISESLCVRWADALIADALGIQQYYRDEFGARTEGIAYGAPDLSAVGDHRLPELGLKPGEFHLVVARFEPENHVDLMIEGYLRSSARFPLIVVGSTPYPAEYSRRVERLAAKSSQVRLLGGIWDQELLDQLYKGAHTYLHGHSVGGTNPSLLRALGAGTRTIAYNVAFNREVVGERGLYASDPSQVAISIDKAEADPEGTRETGALLAKRAVTRYDWNTIARAYGNLCEQLADGFSQRGHWSGRRNHSPQWHGTRTQNVIDGQRFGADDLGSLANRG